MSQILQDSAIPFTDRRSQDRESHNGPERRQFSDSRNLLRPEVQEISEAIDEYKIKNLRRFITMDEIYDIITELGYHK